jgi:putative SOS response-associated peptidase YedK
MCGRLNVVDDPGVRALCDSLDIELGWENQIFSRYTGAASQVSVVRQSEGVRKLENATWWLLLDITEDGFRPSKYTSINTRYDSLNNPRKAGYRPFRQGRIVIPVKGFGESEYQKGKLLHCHDMVAEEGLLLGGLCKEWVHPDTGEVRLSCSVITLPPHEKLASIHSKSMPMILPNDRTLLDNWLDNEHTDTAQFTPLLRPFIPQNLQVQQIARPKQYEQVIGEPFVIPADET